MSRIELVVPDLGNFDEVDVIDVLVKAGDTIEVDTPLVTLETDKATMDVPSTAAGKVIEVLVQKGGKVGKGGVIARVEGRPRRPQPPRAAPARGCRARRDSRACAGRAAPAAPRRAGRAAGARSRRARSSPTCRTIARPSCSCSAPVPAATPRRSARPTSASRSRWSSAGRCSAASA